MWERMSDVGWALADPCGSRQGSSHQSEHGGLPCQPHVRVLLDANSVTCFKLSASQQTVIALSSQALSIGAQRQE